MKKHKNKKIRQALLMLFTLGGVALSCQSTPTQNSSTVVVDSIRVEHKLGSVSIPKKPERTAVLDIGALETMQELGILASGVPKKFLPNYLMGLKDNAAVIDLGSVIEPDFEAIASVKPQLILISTRMERFYNELSEIAPTVFIGIDAKNYLTSFEANIKQIGSIYNKEALAQAKLDSLHNKIKVAQAKYSQDPHKALFLIYNNGKFSAFGKGSRFGFIHDVLGIKPVLDLQDESVHGQRVSNELIAEANPDYLFIVDRNAAVLGKVTSKEEVENKLLKQTNAYKNNKVFYLDPNVWFISGGGLLSVNLMLDDIDQLIK